MSIPAYFCLESYTSEQDVLQTVQGMKLEFEEGPLQVVGFSRFHTPKNQPLIQKKVNKLLKKGVVVEFEHDALDYIWPIL